MTKTVTTPPYMHYMAIIMPLFMLTLSIYLVSFQLLHFSFVQAETVHKPATLPGTLSPLLSKGRFIKTTDPQQRITLSIGLRPRNVALLQQATQSLSNPGGHLDQLHAMSFKYYMKHFGPTDDLYARLSHYLSQAGFSITRSYTHHLLLDFSGTVAQAEHLFHVQINTYTTPDGWSFFSNATAPQLPTWLVEHITGLNGLSSAVHWLHASIQTQLPINTRPENATIPTSCPFTTILGHATTPLDADSHLNALYQVHYRGEGQDIALFELSSDPGSWTSTGRFTSVPFLPHDIATYMACSGQSKTILKLHAVMSKALSLPAMTTREMVADTDVLLHALPRLHTLNVYTTGNNETDYLSQWAQIIQDATPIVATNWGFCEQQLPLQVIQQEYYLFQLAALQGQNVLASSNDNTGCTNAAGRTMTTTASGIEVMDPAAQPFVIAISGITQRSWNTAMQPGIPSSNKVAGIEGGSSRYWLMPDWQYMSTVPGIPDGRNRAAHPCQPLNHATGYCRTVPDVALMTDSSVTYWMYCSIATQCASTQTWTRIGGPTVAVPLWAAFLALTDEMSQQKNGTHRGFLAPLLYRIASDPIAYTACFRDLIVIEQTHYQITHPFVNTGYNSVSGLGDYNAWSLAQHLISPLAYSKPSVQKTELNIHSQPKP